MKKGGISSELVMIIIMVIAVVIMVFITYFAFSGVS